MNLKRATISAVLFFLLCPAAPVRGQANEGAAFDQSKFVPDIAFILDVSGVTRTIADQRYLSLTVPGFSFPFLNQPSPAGSNVRRGMNFNYGELSLSSVVDPYFDLFAVLGLDSEHAGIEEAYFTTRKLPYGFKLKAGKFLASFGRINEQHEHFWSFANRPLVAVAFFGEDGLNEVGAQATWVAPTSTFLMLGAEVLNGTNAESFGATGFADPAGGASVEAVQGPNLWIGFIRTSFDIGEASFLLGLSNAIGRTHGDRGFSSADPAGAAVDARTDIAGADLTMKLSLDAIRFISFQAEYMYRTMDGTEYAYAGAGRVVRPGLVKHHSGLYAQGVFKFDQQWALGVRCDLLMQNEVLLGGADMKMPSDLGRYSAMVEYDPTEFSRFRLQFDRDESLYVPGAGTLARQPYTQVLLQANLTIGAHGAHAF